MKYNSAAHEISVIIQSGLMALVFLFGVMSLNANAADKKTILILGDSLSAGYGLGPAEAFPEQLGKALESAGIDVEIINAGVSGDTTAGGLARLDWSVGDNVDGVILELGANDALRGISPKLTAKNLDAMIARLKKRKITVLLTGMKAPPNMGDEYGSAFNRIYSDLAAVHGVVLYPFFLEGVAADRNLNQADGIHPTKEGIGVIVDAILPTVKEFIAQITVN